MVFAQASNFRVDNSQFVASTNAYFVERPKSREGHELASTSPLKTLLRRAAISATHESSLAAYAPRCKPGTREQVIGDLVGWARQTEDVASSRILWFSGPAGGGKTCIQREVANQLRPESPSREKTDLAASYFFSNRAGEKDVIGPIEGSSTSPGSFRHDGAGMLDSVDPFIATIAYQLVMLIPGLMPHVEEAIKNDPLIFDKGLDIQARKIISEPLAAWRKPRFWTNFKRQSKQLWRPSKHQRERASAYPDTVVIDGWDEIRNHAKRQLLLDVIRQLALHEVAPLRFIISSRPEHDIRTMFSSPEFESITQHIRLEEYNGDDDIRTYLCDEFERIRRNHPARASLQDWPPEEAVDSLVTDASGQFIYPSVVIKFIDNPRRHPVDLLNQVLERNVTAQQREGVSQPLAELYSLYDIIFRPPDVDRSMLRRTLHTIHAMVRAPPSPDTGFVDQLLSLPMGTTSIVLCDLHSLVNVPDDESGDATSEAGSTSDDSFINRSRITFHHKTTIDYLLDPDASGDLYQPLYESYADLATCCVGHLSRWNTLLDEERLMERTPALYYAAFYWDVYTGLALDANLCLPPGLDTFDPHIPWSYGFLHIPNFGAGYAIAWNLEHRLPHVHSALCQDTQCIPFCERLRHVLKVNGDVKTVFNRIFSERLTLSSVEILTSKEYSTLLKMFLPDYKPTDSWSEIDY